MKILSNTKWRHLWRDRSGASAVEFAMVAPLFFAIMFSCFEAGWIMVQETMLDRAVDLVVREIRIAPDGLNFDQATIRSKICKKTIVIQNCENSLLVEMIPINKSSDFPNDSARCVNRETKVNPIFRYTPGGRSQVVFMRACVIVDLITPLMGLALALPKDSSGGFALVSSTAFMNEPS